MDTPYSNLKYGDTSQLSHMSIIPLYLDDHQDLQALRYRKDNSIKADSDDQTHDIDIGSGQAIKKDQIDHFDNFPLEIAKKAQTSTLYDQSKQGSPKLSPRKDFYSHGSGPHQGAQNFLEVENHSVYQGSCYSKSKGERVPRRLMRAINLLVNVKSFYNQLTKNTRIFQKLTQEQYNLIGDKASFYSSKIMQKPGHKKRWLCLQIASRFISEVIRLVESIPIIEPHKKLKTMWDSLQGLLIILIIFFFSLVIVFRIDPQQYIRFLQVTLILFCIDILMQFNTGIIIKGSVEFSRLEIAKKYCKGNFIMDIIGILPIIQVNSSILYGEDNSEQKSTNIPQILFQCTVLFKCFMLKNIFERLEQRFGYQKNLENVIDLFKLLFTIGSICHFFSLLWFGLGDYEINVLKNKDSWIPYVGIQDGDIYTKYIYSFYYVATTMITVGYGDITPQNPMEVTFSVVTMFLTGVVYAYSLNCIGNILDNINESHKDFRRDMRTMHHLMEEQNVKQSLRVKISNYVEYLCKESNNQKKAKQDEIVSKLSEKLRLELMNEIKGKFISDIPLFKDIITQQTQSQMLEQMEECLFSPGEVIFQHHDQDDCSIYYLLKGQVKISLEDQVHRTVRFIEKRGCFGEISFITGNERIGTATATDFCRIYKIKREDFQSIIKENAQDFENFQMLYEAVCLKGNLKFAKLYCYSCKRGDHIAQMCPKTHLIFSKQILIQKYNKTQPILERTPQNRRKLRQNTKSISHQIQDALINIHSIAEYDDIIHIIEKIAHLNDSFLELYYADEEQSNYDAISNNYLLNKKESIQEKFIKSDKQQSVKQNENDMGQNSNDQLDKNDLTPSQSSSDEHEESSHPSSHDTTTIEFNSQSEFSSHKKNKLNMKKSNGRKTKNHKSQRRFGNDINENVIQESSEESNIETNSHTISNATKFGNQMIKVAQKYHRESEISAISGKEGQEEGFQLDEQSRKYFKEFEDEFQLKSPDVASKNSLYGKSKQSMKSFTGINTSVLGPSTPLQKRKSLHKEVLEKQNFQTYMESEGNMYKNMITSPIYNQQMQGDRNIPSQSVLSNIIHQQNQSIIGFNDINISSHNLEETPGTREKKSNSMSASKYKLDEQSGKQIVGGYRKSVSFDPGHFTNEIQKNMMKKQISGSINKNSTIRSEEQNKRYNKPHTQSSYQKIPSALRNHSSLALQYHSSINNVNMSGQINMSGQVGNSLQRMSTKNFKRQSTKTNTRASNHSFSSQQSNLVSPIIQKGIMKRGQGERSQLQPNDMRIIQQNEEKLLEIYEKQQEEYDDDLMNTVKYGGSQEDNDIDKEVFDCMKNYVYYYPQFNASIVISNYQQIMNEKNKLLKKRPTLVGKNLKGRIKRVINTKKPSQNVNSSYAISPMPQTQFNILEKSLPGLVADKSQKSIQYYNTNIKTNLLQSTEKIVTALEISNNPSKYVFQNASQQIQVIDTQQDKIEESQQIQF